MIHESIQPRIKIDDSEWIVEFFDCPDDGGIGINLICQKTGEIRQKRMSYDALARRVFASEMKTWKHSRADMGIKTIPIKEKES